MATTLINRTRRPLTIILSHPKFRVGGWGWRRQGVTTRELGKDGVHRPKVERRSVDGVLTLRPGERRLNLPDEIAQVPDVVRMVAQKRVLVQRVEVTEAPAAEQPKPARKRSGRGSNKSKSAPVAETDSTAAKVEESEGTSTDGRGGDTEN